MRRFYKPVLIGIAGLITVMLGLSVILPNQVMTSKWVRVSQDKDSVIRVVKDLHTWDQWNSLLTGAQVVDVKDSLLNWTSPNGHMNSIRIEGVEDNGVSTSISLNRSTYFNSGFSIEKRSSDSVQVVWYIIEDLKWYPWEKFYGMMAADMKGPLMQESLDRLKSYLDQR
jgi:hypothetical protein